MLEGKVQRYFITEVKKRALGVAVKVDCTSRRGWPDLNYVDPVGSIKLIEMKSTDGVLSPHQIEVHAELLANWNYTVPVLSSKAEVDTYLNEIYYAYFA